MASSKSVCMAALMLLLISSSLISGTPPPSPKLNAHHSNLHSLGEGVVDTKTEPLHSSLMGCEGNMKAKNEGKSDEDIDYDSDKDDIKTR
nr:uncharacterized protein DDB_G0290685-like [Ipomoea batatas]GME18566.1 uncharacterized protein DDB_G0290685-like [Ipomoea batatas]